MKAKTLCSLFVVVAMLSMAPLAQSAKTIGMVADDNTNSVTVFDGDKHTVLGTVPIPESFFIGDVVITPNLKRGFVSNTDPYVTVIDLTTSPPSLVEGMNPIPISNHFAQDVTVSPNGKFLLVTDGFTDPVSQPISVINVPAQAEVSTFFTDEDFSSSDFCSNSSVLVTANDIVRKLILSRAGTLTDTGEALSVTEPWNVYCAPGGQSGVVIHRSSSSGWEVTSFTIPGLSAVNTRPLSGLTSGLSGAISPSGNRVFVRSNGPGSVDVFDFNSATGALGADPLLTISIADAPVFFIGMEQLALHPNGEVVFVPEPGKVNVYNQ